MASNCIFCMFLPSEGNPLRITSQLVSSGRHRADLSICGVTVKIICLLDAWITYGWSTIAQSVYIIISSQDPPLMLSKIRTRLLLTTPQWNTVLKALSHRDQLLGWPSTILVKHAARCNLNTAETVVIVILELAVSWVRTQPGHRLSYCTLRPAPSWPAASWWRWLSFQRVCIVSSWWLMTCSVDRVDQLRQRLVGWRVYRVWQAVFGYSYRQCTGVRMAACLSDWLWVSLHLCSCMSGWRFVCLSVE